MEYLERATLAERLRKGPLSLTEAVKIGLKITDAMDKAHRVGVVNRDLKPANVFRPGTALSGIEHGAECLAKDPVDRWHSAHDVGLQLKWASAPSTVPADAVATKPNRRATLAIGALSVALLLALIPAAPYWRSIGSTTTALEPSVPDGRARKPAGPVSHHRRPELGGRAETPLKPR